MPRHSTAKAPRAAPRQFKVIRQDSADWTSASRVSAARSRFWPSERAASNGTEADLKAVRRFELSDQAGLTLGTLDRPLAEPEHIAGILVAGSLAQRASEQLRQGHN